MTTSTGQPKRVVTLTVVANKPFDGIYRGIEIDLDDPALDPAAAALAQCLRKKQIDACVRSVLTRREIIAQVPDAARRERLLGRAAAFNLDLDGYDEIRVQPRDRWFDGEHNHLRQYETPVEFLNRVAALNIPTGYYPVGPWRLYGEDEIVVDGADTAQRVAQYLSLTQFARRKGITKQGLQARKDLPPEDVRVGTARGWLPETVDAYTGVGQGHRSDLHSKGRNPASDPPPF